MESAFSAPGNTQGPQEHNGVDQPGCCALSVSGDMQTVGEGFEAMNSPHRCGLVWPSGGQQADKRRTLPEELHEDEVRVKRPRLQEGECTSAACRPTPEHEHIESSTATGDLQPAIGEIKERDLEQPHAAMQRKSPTRMARRPATPQSSTRKQDEHQGETCVMQEGARPATTCQQGLDLERERGEAAMPPTVSLAESELQHIEPGCDAAAPLEAVGVDEGTAFADFEPEDDDIVERVGLHEEEYPEPARVVEALQKVFLQFKSIKFEEGTHILLEELPDFESLEEAIASQNDVLTEHYSMACHAKFPQFLDRLRCLEKRLADELKELEDAVREAAPDDSWLPSAQEAYALTLAEELSHLQRDSKLDAKVLEEVWEPYGGIEGYAKYLADVARIPSVAAKLCGPPAWHRLLLEVSMAMSLTPWPPEALPSID
eukprot:CAMPEP_0117618708 /NCGR_PEP_ID=MMETSP0784-20121206/86240_1 /TAXON_ID=39447 /ORGANISM="" /LENGTH=430 /DNA_ID=CAMNT_0005422575 /DNA_START=36 /DNA_END=1325 /DNA_ORIENTATION=+